MKLHLPKAWYSVVLAACMTCTAQAGITSSNPYSITLEDGTSTFTAAAEIPGEGDSPATPAVTLRILTCDNANTDVVDGYTGATYTVLASTATSDSTYSQGRFYIDADNEATRINGMGTLIIANGTYRAVENGNAQNFYGGQLKLVERSVSNDIIIGSETYTENWTGATDAARVNYSGAIQLTHNAKLTGSNLTLVADSQIGVEGDGTKIAYIENAISGAGKSLELLTDHAGNAIHLSGGASLKTLSGAANVVLDDKKSDGSTNATSKTYELVNATGAGALTIDSGVSLILLGDAANATLQTTDKEITNSNGTLSGEAGILIGKADTTNTVVLNKTQDYGAVHVRGKNTLKIDCTGAASGHFDLNGQGSIYSGKLVIGSKASVTAKQNLWFNQNGGIEILNGGQLTRGVMVINTQDGKNASIKRTSGTGGTEFGAGNGDITVENAELTIQRDGTDETVVSMVLKNSSLINNSAGDVRENSSKNTSYVAVEAAEGNIVFAQKGAGLTVGDLSLADSKTITTWSGFVDESTLSTLTITGAMEAGTKTSVLNNLVLSDGVSLDFSGSVAIKGALTLGTGLTLDESMVLGNSYTLFTGVTSLTLGTAGYTSVVDASTIFKGIDQGTYNLVYANNAVSLSTIPEPTTATLSLLALAGLAARRRRK